MAENLHKIGVDQIVDLLFHLPLRYQDRTRFHPLGSLQPGQELLVKGVIEHSEIVYRGRRMLLCTVSDGTGLLTLRFFYFSNSQQKDLKRGLDITCFGEVRKGPQTLEMVHPEYRILKQPAQSAKTALQSGLTPVYPAAKGLQQRTLLRLTGEALTHLDSLEELLPEPLLKQLGLLDLAQALLILHRPGEDQFSNVMSVQVDSPGPAQKRLAFEEMLAHHLSLGKLRARIKKDRGVAIRSDNRFFQQLTASLPFRLTSAQQRVITEIHDDLIREHPMIRLVQGDVGCGKTLVAAAAILAVIEAGFQVALMAPTEILAEQHYQSFVQWFEPLALQVTLLSGRQTAVQRREALKQLESGQTRLAIGTHALFQTEVLFKHLGLVIIDEQHRFGVHQRLALREKGLRQTLDGKDFYPHQLVMTATPIPRTLAMTAYADLDYSLIDELPPGRTPVNTVVVNNTRRDEIIRRIESVCRSGAQVYWVCTLIEESESLQCQNAEQTCELLQQSLPQLRIGLVHGRLKAEQKKSVMAEFKEGRLDLLVATTVIEVGVDVPNASLMVIENAERLGLAQLHQLRGRVGRGSQASSCVLLYQAPLSANGRKRLDALRNSNDGFVIAQTDLEIRGPGEVFGTRQTGELQFRIADLLRDQVMLPEIRKAAKLLLRDYPERVDPLIERWIKQAESYAAV